MKDIEKPFREIIRNKLLEDILQGRINAGEKLLESELAEKFQVSRTPVREALLQLEKEEYITHRKNVGAVVKKISARKVQEIYEIVAQLEAYATEKATDKIGEKGISYLQTLLNRMKDSIKKKDYTTYVQENIQFHNFFVKNCGNETLQQIISGLRRRIYKVIAEGLTLPMHADRYSDWHRKIVNAISERNPVKAGKLMKGHVDEVRKRLLEKMINLD